MPSPCPAQPRLNLYFMVIQLTFNFASLCWVDLPLRTALGDEDCVPLDPEQEEGGEEERPHGVLAGDWLNSDPTLHTRTW